MERRLDITPQWILTIALGISVVLICLHLIGQGFVHLLDRDYVLGFVPLFNINGESNVPTLFSSLMLVANGLLCFVAAKALGEFRLQWLFMGMVFILLGVDETFGLHEPVFFLLRGNRSIATAQLA